MPYRAAAVAAVACALLALWGRTAFAPAQDEVRIDLSTDAAKRMGLLAEGFVAGGPGARTFGPQVDGILANDLEYSGLFDVTRAWQQGSTLPTDVQAVVGGKVSVTGSALTLTGEIKDFPARRLIARAEYRGSTADLRRLVHRFADDVALHLTGEAGVAQTRIAYVAKGTRSSELHVVDMDGYGGRALTAFKSPLTSPAWTSEGRDILFAALRGAAWNVYGVPLAGGASRQVTRGGTLNHAPTVASDGAIAYASNKDGNTEIYVANADGSGSRRLTVNRAIDTSPAWAPNAQRLAFTSDRGGNPQIYVMDRDGGNQRRLVMGFGYTDSPDWSPKGDRIAFVVRSGNGFDIYVAGADGSNPHAIVTGGGNENPHWSPDGRLVVFSSNRGGGRGIWITDARGQSARRLDVPGPATNPAWSPRPAAAPATGAAAGK
jgi:TolB protein